MEAFYLHIANKLEAIQYGKDETRYKVISRQEMETPQFWRAVFAEFLAQILYVYLGCSATQSSFQPTDVTLHIQTSLTFGLAMMAMYQMTSHVSGGHVNPVITVAMTILRKISAQRCIFYLLAQFNGGLVGGLMARAMFPPGIQDFKYSKSVPQFGDQVSTLTGFLMEAILTFVVVIVFIGCTDKKFARLGYPAEMIGLTVTLCHFTGLRYTGASLNPSRYLGPAISDFQFDHLSIYFVAPLVGGVLATAFYRLVLNPVKTVGMEEALLKVDGESNILDYEREGKKTGQGTKGALFRRLNQFKQVIINRTVLDLY